MKVYRDIIENDELVSKEVFDIIECTYTGKFMGERSITATINWPSPIDFRVGDYVDLDMQSLVRGEGGEHGDVAHVERFYIYTMPTVKKTARAMSHGTAFEHTVTLYPAQHELACVQMRDMGNSMSADSVIYTGFDTVTFYGGAFELMERIMQVLNASYNDGEGNGLWSYEIADAINEQKNTALERFAFSFSGNTVMDALLKLTDKEGINTTFFINNRKIYVGFKRPYFCRVTEGNSIDTNISTQMFTFKYGKTSHESTAISHGGLFDITKTIGKELPITKLFAYGASRNLNRYYCSDRIAGGRYVNRLMLPSFDIDGKTDYIISEDAAAKYGIREGSKQFEDIYPSLRYMTYGDLRTIKYCIKVKASGLTGDNVAHSSIDIARVQCYKVVEGSNGVNSLVESAPQDDLAIYVHAEGKVVKVVLYGGLTNEDATEKQRSHDILVPTRTVGGSDYIPGSCFLVHDDGFGSNGALHREDWFANPEAGNFTDEEKEEIKLHQIKYTDTFWLTDLYVFQSYEQTYFSRDGYSAWSWPRLNSKYTTERGNVAKNDTIVNTVIGVEPVTIVDTNMTAADLDKQQKSFDIYLGDTGFKIDEQNDFGEMVFVVAGTVKVSFLDGMLAGREFDVSGSVTDSQFSCICAYNDDGTLNDDFFNASDYSGTDVPQQAFQNGAIWRLRLNRMNLDEPDYSNLNMAIPNTLINASAGDHIVLLDIFMPDIYIHAAENRLLREARKYLDANDSGTVNYAITLDNVRMQQVPLYASQMREGLNVRMEDEDLSIQTENNGRYLVDYRDKHLVSSSPVAEVTRNWEYVKTYISAKASVTSTELIVTVVLANVENWLNNPIRIVQNGVNYDLGRPRRTESLGWSSEEGGYVYKIYYSKPSNIDFGSPYDIYRNQIKSLRKTFYLLSTSHAIDFTKGRYYNINLRVKDNGYVTPNAINFWLNQTRNGNESSFTLPDIKVEKSHREGESYLYLSISFYLGDSFNDSTVYYPTLRYSCDGRDANIALELISVYEQDYADGSTILPYADFTIDSVTVKIYDSSNRTNSRPIKEISATLSEQNNATSWATLMNRVEKTEKESERNKQTYQEVVNTARRHYQTLLNLRDSIFDPDGKCDQTFLQVMMLQVGADSMNYQLHNTRVGLNEDGDLDYFNCSCYKHDDGFYHFVVNNADTLDHFVFTEGIHGGTWDIPSGIDKVLTKNDDGEYPTYFVSIKCPKDGGDASWICETVQRKVNEDQTAWYFNWGIIIPDGDTYSATETRGNAYMYGDNLVCGKISTLAGKSYFDLTRGDFVLADNDSNASLSYIDGKLTISGISELMNSFTTEITGGLVLTNVIELKNEQGEVTAGLSGIDSDNVLMWGGGTYDTAKEAAKDNAHITTVIKKDGTGKIGVFNIDDNKVVVDVLNQGKVIIDATEGSGGIYIEDNDGVDKIAITTKTLEDSGMLPAVDSADELSISGNMAGSCISSGNYMQYGNETKITISNQYYNSGTLTLNRVSIPISNIIHKNIQSSATVTGNASFRFEIRSLSGEVLYASAETTTSINLSDVTVMLNGGYCEMCLIAKSRCSAYSPCKTTFDVSYVISGVISFSDYKPKTLICKDGFLSAFDANHYFMVKNSNSGQEIYARGLSDKKGTDGTGKLYTSSDFINAFSDFLDKMYAYVEDVRTIGGNKDNADAMQSAISSVKAQLTETSLIANS